MTIMNLLRRMGASLVDAARGLRDLASSRIGVAALVLTIGFAVVTYVFPGPWVIELSNYLVLALSATVFGLWVPFAAHVARNDRGSGSQYLLIGITVIALGIFGGVAWSIGWRYFDRPDGMLDSPVIAYTRLLVFAGLAMMVVTPGMRDDELPIKHLGLVAVGMLAAGLLLGFGLGAVSHGDRSSFRELFELGSTPLP